MRMRTAGMGAMVIAGAALALAAPRPRTRAADGLTRVATFPMPAAVKGRFDHLTADTAGNRLFLAAESAHEVLIFNLRSGRYERAIPAIEIPHAVFVRTDLGRIYVTDGGAGVLRIYNAKTYRQTGTVALKKDADSIGYDPSSQDLYIDNGGGDVHESFSMFSAVNTRAGKLDWQIEIPGDTLEAMAVARNSPRIYVNNRARNLVTVVNRQTHAIEANWPVTKAKFNVAMAFDEAHGRLFVGCRSGAVVVMDANDGHEITALPIPTGVDDLRFDPATQTIYAATGSGGGAITAYKENSPDSYTAAGATTTGRGGKNEDVAGGRLYVTIPPSAAAAGAVQVYRVR